jgi:hydrogenase nickel incorporation protein HypA/HybF
VHELSIVEALIEEVKKEVERAGETGRVARLDLKIGRLSGVNTDSIRFAYQLLAPGTLLEGADLQITEPSPLCCCRSCGARTEVEELIAACPRCHSGDIFLEGGHDLLLESIELVGVGE